MTQQGPGTRKTIYIQEIEEKYTKKDNKWYRRINADGEWVSVFGTVNGLEQFAVGETWDVDFTLKQGTDGKMYNNITKIHSKASPTVPAVTNNATPRQQAPATPEQWGTLDERIAWNSGINNANQATRPPENVEDEPRWIEDIYRRANLLNSLIRRGPTAEDATQEPYRDPSAEDVQYIEEVLNEEGPF